MISRETLKTFIGNAKDDTKYIIENVDEFKSNIVFIKRTEPNGILNVLISRETPEGEWLENIDYKDL